MMKFEELTFINQIGKGSFGTVYLTSIEGKSDNYFATKVIKKSVADSPKVKKYFHNEINRIETIRRKLLFSM